MSILEKYHWFFHKYGLMHYEPIIINKEDHNCQRKYYYTSFNCGSKIIKLS